MNSLVPSSVSTPIDGSTFSKLKVLFLYSSISIVRLCGGTKTLKDLHQFYWTTKLEATFTNCCCSSSSNLRRNLIRNGCGCQSSVRKMHSSRKVLLPVGNSDLFSLPVKEGLVTLFFFLCKPWWRHHQQLMKLLKWQRQSCFKLGLTSFLPSSFAVCLAFSKQI